MFRSLYWKLALAFALVAFATAALVAVLSRASSADRLTQFVIDQQLTSMQAALAGYYAAHGSWSGIAGEWRQIQFQTVPTAVAFPSDHDAPGVAPSGEHNRRSLFGLADADGNVLVSIDPTYPQGSSLPANLLAAGTPIVVNGNQVGTLLTARQLPGFSPEESRFLERTTHALVLAVVIALVAALIIGILLARTLTHPLHALTLAAGRIAQGQLEQQVKVTSRDEIGQLAASFNRMSQEVARVNQLRRQMTADIAHDLRTPLTVIAGYVESMRDGVLQPTPERFALIYAEIERLQNLVGDLRMLSQVDAGELPLSPQRISPRTLLERAAALYRHHAERQKVKVSVDANGGLPDIRVDEARMMQILDNLLSNALRYTPEGGRILLSAQASKGTVDITVQDTGIGIAAQELPYIFDRFYRADPSRHTEGGETGLGLAIVKALTEAQGGRVWAESTFGKGTSIHVELPA